MTQFTSSEKKLISIVIPMHNEAANLETLYIRLNKVLNNLNYHWEIIGINDGSKDDTLKRLIALHKQDSRIKIIDLSRNFGKEAALTSGIDYAKGDVIIPFDADLQDPPEFIPQLIQKYEEGFDVVNAVRQSRAGESWLKKYTSHVFYKTLNKVSSVKIPENTGDFRLLSKPVIEELRKLPERRRFMKGLFSWVGFRTTEIFYEREPRFAGRTKWNYWKLWNFALEGITSFSQLPLQFASYLGLLVALSSFVYAAYMIIKTLIYGNPVPGYPSVMVAILFIGGVQLMALGVIGEYLGRVYDEVKQRPIYIVKHTWL